MPNVFTRGRFFLFSSVLCFGLAWSGSPVVLGHTPDDNNIPHSLQLLALLQQDESAAAKTKTIRHNDRSELRSAHAKLWLAGLDAFREARMKAAAENFTALLAENNTLPSCDRAAVAFWAYRAYMALGDKDNAAKYLGEASNETPGFYSIIARHISGLEEVPSESNDDTGVNVASLYPMPKWTPSLGYKVEPALLFAIMRQESEFNPYATSAKGAMGVMQLMPETARAMARNIKLSGSIAEPSNSMALGQQYLKQLMESASIQNNMLYLLAAYNAGPAMVEKWQKNNSYNNDPLLFVESIPYGATRDYVINVMGNYWVYSGLFGDNENASVAMISKGSWPLYSGSTKEVVADRN